jgi:uncharacterized protein YggT (Ycf19 family)
LFQLYQLLSLALGVLMWTLIGQGLLAVMIGQHREQNFVYRFFATITRPLFRLTRWVSPRFVADAHLGFVALFLVLAARVGLYMLFYSQGWIPSLQMVPVQ